MAVIRGARRAAAAAVAAGAIVGGLATGASAATAAGSGHSAASVGAARVSSSGSSGTTNVVVMAAPGHEAQVQRLAVQLGAHITRRLGIINGFAASVTPAARVRIAGSRWVVSVSPDRKVRPLSLVPTLGYDPTDAGSSSSVAQEVGATTAWGAGVTGQGVDVAVIDTGVAPVPGLDNSGQVITGPDLSLDASGSANPGVDAYGHGTFMAGIIAGRDDAVTASATGCTTCLNSSGYSDTTKYVGIAPGARIVNVRVGAADGATDVSQVIAAIDWVAQHAHDPGFNIRVLNLSFGTTATQSYLVDPLAQAAEQAWKHGIVVVAAAGNDGLASVSLADPAYDPYVIAVGGDDTNGTVTTVDDRVASFAQHGNALRPVDVVAPATHIIGLRVPGSYIDTLASNTGQVGTRFQRGSGTSEATAVVSGVAALLEQKYPTATPDQIKALIDNSATALAGIQNTAALASLASKLGLTPAEYLASLNALNTYYAGHGVVNVAAALSTALPTAKQTAILSTGSGTLDGSRGGVYLVDGTVSLTGQKDIFGKAFSSSAMAAAQTTETTWTGGIWNGSRWTGDGWTGSRWTTAVWSGTDWAGNAWTGSRWTGMTWDGSRWTGSGWSGSRWTGSSWSGSRWSSASWG